MGEFTMPSLGADMDKGTLAEWKVAVGDEVTRGDIVAVVETDKSDVEVEVFETGVVAELLVAPGTEVAVGTPLARIAAEGAAPGPAPAPAAEPEPAPAEAVEAAPVEAAEAASAPAPAPAALPAPAAEPAPAPQPLAPLGTAPGRAHAGKVLSPVVRHLAEQLHVDAAHLPGSGPGGRVTRADVEAAAAGRGGRVAASPLARRLAADARVDLSAVVGSGPGGAIVAADLHGMRGEPAPPEPTPPAADAPARRARRDPAERQLAMRAAIARLMETANREIPHYHVLSSLDVGGTSTWLDRRNATTTPAERVLMAAVLLRATAMAALQVPELNGWWQEGRFVPSERVDLGVVISLRDGGLVTPTISDAGSLSLVEVMAALRDLVTRSRRGALRSADLAPASLSVTNLGEQGAEEVLGLIHPPQVAIVGFGRPVDRVVAVDGMVAVRPTIRATVSGDHRATDGHAGSRLLAAIGHLLDAPDHL